MKALDKALSYVGLLSLLGFYNGFILIFKKLAGLIFSRNNDHQITRIGMKGFDRPVHIRLESSDFSVFRDIYVNEEYREQSDTHAHALRKRYENIVSSGRRPLILDLGANIGLASLWYNKQFPEATILSVEPESKNFELLRQNTAHCNQIISINSAVSNRASSFSLVNETSAPWSWQVVEKESGDVQSVTIDGLVSMVPNSVPLVAKIDIEGHEKTLFEHCPDSLLAFPLVVCEHHDWLYAWTATAHAVYNAISTKEVRDYIQRSENTFCYSHALLRDCTT